MDISLSVKVIPEFFPVGTHSFIWVRPGRDSTEVTRERNEIYYICNYGLGSHTHNRSYPNRRISYTKISLIIYVITLDDPIPINLRAALTKLTA